MSKSAISSKLSLTTLVVLAAALAGCAAKPIEHVVPKTQYVVLAPNDINTRSTPVPSVIMTGCDEKNWNARTCLTSRTTTADRALTALGMCNADKAEIRKTIQALRFKAEEGDK